MLLDISGHSRTLTINSCAAKLKSDEFYQGQLFIYQYVSFLFWSIALDIFTVMKFNFHFNCWHSDITFQCSL